MVVRHQPLRAGVYSRIRYEDALDLAMQGHALASFAAVKGWHVVHTELEIAEEYATRLPARDRILRHARNGDLDVVVAWKLDRFARDLPELIALLHDLDARGVGLATLADDFDFTSGEGPRLRQILRALASFERATHRDKIKSGVNRALRLGSPVGRPSSAREHLSEILVLRDKGCSQREIARRVGLHPRTVARLLSKEPEASIGPGTVPRK